MNRGSTLRRLTAILLLWSLGCGMKRLLSPNGPMNRNGVPGTTVKT